MKTAVLKVAYIFVVAVFYIIFSYVTRDISFGAVEEYLNQYNLYVFEYSYLAVQFSEGYFGVPIILLRLL